MPETLLPPRAKPLLRGVSHEIAAFAAAPASLALIASANSPSAQVGAATYGTSLFTLFLVSAVLHRPTWSPRARHLVGRLDYSAIFLLIAGTGTPVCLLLGGGLLTLAGVGLAAAEEARATAPPARAEVTPP